MTTHIRNLLHDNGYLVYESNGKILIRRKVTVGVKNILVLLLPGMVFMLLGFIVQSSLPGFAIFSFGSGLVLVILPFLNYLTSAYRSLAIDRQNRTLLFRSSFARAYSFSDISAFKLEVVGRVEKNDSTNYAQDYILNLYFKNKSKEELLFLSLGESQSEQIIFQLKDYFHLLFNLPRE